MKKWKCTVCGYIHTGDEPPDECPVCGAPRSEFVEITEAVDSSLTAEAEMLEDDTVSAVPVEEPERTEKATVFARITDLMLRNHLHPIAVHTPNGIMPAAVVFLLLALVLQNGSFELAAFYNLIFVLVVMPLVLFTGFIEWRKHYRGAKTAVFFIKIACGIVVLLSLAFLAAWRITIPGVAAPDSPDRWIYLLVHLIPLGAVGLAGHLGGKLVFGKKTVR